MNEGLLFSIRIRDLTEFYKDKELKKFMKENFLKVVEPLKDILEPEDIDPKELFEAIFKKKIEEFEEKVKNKVGANNPEKNNTPMKNQVDKEFKPVCFKCKTSDFLEIDKTWKWNDVEQQRFRWICTKCNNKFISEKRTPKGEITKSSPEKDTNNETKKEKKMKRFAFGLFNNVGVKDIHEITTKIKEQFFVSVDSKEVAIWIEEETNKRLGLTCGKMKCFRELQERLGTEEVFCSKVNQNRKRNDLICEEMLNKK